MAGEMMCLSAGAAGVNGCEVARERSGGGDEDRRGGGPVGRGLGFFGAKRRHGAKWI